MSNRVLELWSELRAGVESLEKDVQKNVGKSNVSAGVRVRKALRTLRAQASLLLKETLASDKQTVEARKTQRPSKNA